MKRDHDAAFAYPLAAVRRAARQRILFLPHAIGQMARRLSLCVWPCWTSGNWQSACGPFVVESMRAVERPDRGQTQAGGRFSVVGTPAHADAPARTSGRSFRSADGEPRSGVVVHIALLVLTNSWPVYEAMLNQVEAPEHFGRSTGCWHGPSGPYNTWRQAEVETEDVGCSNWEGKDYGE